MATNERRALVNLSVVAASAAMLAAAWLGIVRADTDRSASARLEPAAVASSRVVTIPTLQPAPTAAAQQAAQATPRRVVIVRESRAS